eukprot:COSAG02_NODE_7017_length_3225_cov_8.096929_1_plen_27_part_10
MHALQGYIHSENVAMCIGSARAGGIHG